MIREADPAGKRGRQPDYSDAAIRTCLTLKGEGRRGNDPVDRFSPERAEPRGSQPCLHLGRLVGGVRRRPSG